MYIYIYVCFSGVGVHSGSELVLFTTRLQETGEVVTWGMAVVSGRRGRRVGRDERNKGR